VKILFSIKTVGRRRSSRHCRVSCSLEAKDNTASLWYSLRKARENAGLFSLSVSCLDVGFLEKKVLYCTKEDVECLHVTCCPIMEYSKFPLNRRRSSLAERRCVTALFKCWGNEFLGFFLRNLSVAYS